MPCPPLPSSSPYSPRYRPLIHMPVNLIKLDAHSTNNVLPFSHYLFPTDKVSG